MKRLLLLMCFPLFIKTAEPPRRGERFTPIRTDSLGSPNLHLIDLAKKEGNSSVSELLLAHGTKAPVTPTRSDSLQNISSDEDKNKLPKSPPLTGLSSAHKPLKMVTISVNVWRNDPCDEDLWNQILEQYYQLKNAPFSSSELFAGITAFIKLTEEKKGNALWGGLSFTEVPDSQRIDNKKAPEKP